jgi:hypothetical protein
MGTVHIFVAGVFKVLSDFHGGGDHHPGRLAGGFVDQCRDVRKEIRPTHINF